MPTSRRDTRYAALQTGLRHIIEPVSAMPKRKLENGEQRLAPKNHRSTTESLEIADQRRGLDGKKVLGV